MSEPVIVVCPHCGGGFVISDMPPPEMMAFVETVEAMCPHCGEYTPIDSPVMHLE